MDILRAISFVASVGAVAAFLFLTVIRPFFSPSGWTKKENDGVAVRFKVFLPLYLQNPEKWTLMPNAARYENTMVYFSTGLQRRKYNRWRKRVRKQRQKAEQEERQRKFMEAIFKEYEPRPNPEFIPPPTVKPKTKKDKPTIIRRELQGRSAVTNLYNGICEAVDDLKSEEAGRWAEKSAIYCVATDKLYVKGSGGEWRETVEEPKTAENGEDCFIVNGGVGNPIIAVIPKPKDGLTNAELDKIRADLTLTAQAQEKQNNPRCKDCVHMKYMQRTNSEKFDTVFDTVCVRHITKLGLEHVWTEMTACGTFEPKIKTQTIKKPEPFGTVTTH